MLHLSFDGQDAEIILAPEHLDTSDQERHASFCQPWIRDRLRQGLTQPQNLRWRSSGCRDIRQAAYQGAASDDAQKLDKIGTIPLGQRVTDTIDGRDIRDACSYQLHGADM